MDSASFSWWSWRPGIKPQQAIALGGILALIGLVLISLSLFQLTELHRSGSTQLPFLLGLLLFCYPALLARWGWRDLLIQRLSPEQIPDLTAEVIRKRSTQLSRYNRPGRVGVGGERLWYGVALQFEKQQAIIPFSVREEQFSTLQEGDRVRVRYSPHLHYVYAIEHLPSQQ